MDLSGKVALITGGAVRVGRALTLALAGAGCDVFVHYGRSQSEARATQVEVEALGVKAAIYPADLADTAAVQAIVPATVSRFGRLDILVNNAAIFLDGDLAATTPAMWESQFAVNLRAPFLLSQAFAAQLPADGRGKIINITDARIFRPAADHFAYRLTKAALLAMTETLAHDLAPRITVNAVALGAILPPPAKDNSYLAQLAEAHVPLRHPGDPEAVAANVLHLLRQDFLTGVTIRVDGGQFL
jgi:NAD(P)-dependent dehydrogenase (short-subunit alcohol dehydrogenase family)